MMRRVSSTSMTSISGVVFISTITSPSPDSLPMFIAMGRYLCSVRRSRRFVARLGQEADLLDAGELTGKHHATDRLEADIAVGADMHLRELVIGAGEAATERVLKPVLELARVDRGVVVVNVLVPIDGDHDVFRLRDRRDVAI